MTSKTIGTLAALGSAASWALGAILFKRLGDQLSSPGMALVKSLLSAVLVGLLLLVVGFDKIDTQALLWLVLSGVLGIALGDTLFFAALKELSPHTLVVLLTGGQVLTVLLAVLFLGEAPSLKVWLGIGLVLAGITVVVWAKLSEEQQTSQLRGIVLGILSVVCMSFSLVIAKKGLLNISAMEGLFVRMLAAGLAMFLFSAFRWRAGDWLAPFKQPGLFWQFFASVCVITFGGFWLSLLAIKHLDVSIANTLNSAEPLFVLPLGYFLLKEKITLAALAGSVIAVAGIALLCVG